MTTLGHSLTGLAALTFCMPGYLTLERKLLWVIFFIGLASLPDWPVPGWGHSLLLVSHSFWVNLTLCVLIFAVIQHRFPVRFGQTRCYLCGGLAWLSHIGMDTLYGDLPGVAIFWPFSTKLASLPLPWLKSLPHVPPPFDVAVLQILLFELITFLPLILLAYGLRLKWPPGEHIK